MTYTDVTWQVPTADNLMYQMTGNIDIYHFKLTYVDLHWYTQHTDRLVDVDVS